MDNGIVQFLNRIFRLFRNFLSQKYVHSLLILIHKMSQDIDFHIENKYKVVEKIGSGAYGHVFKVINRKTKRVKALKKNFDAFHNSTDAQRTYRQIMFLYELHHPNIIGIDEVFIGENGKDVYIVFEYMEADLHLVVRKKILTEKHIKYITYQVAKALLYMHSADLIHRDLKPSNILLNDSCQAKLCDFGLVRSIDQNNHEDYDILTEYIATRWYRAPELILGSKNYSTKIDVWSFGCTIAQIIKGKPLFPGTSTLNQLQRILKWTGLPTQSEIQSLKINISKQILQQASKTRSHKANHFQYFQQIDPQCLDLIEKCLQFNPEKRISFEEIVKHPYLSEFYNKIDIIKSRKKITTPVDDNSRFNLKVYRSLIGQFIEKKLRSTEDLKISIKQVKPYEPPIFKIRQTKKQVKTQQSECLHQYSEMKKPRYSVNEQKSQTVSFKCPQLPKKASFLLDNTSLCEQKLNDIQVIGQNTKSIIIKEQMKQSNDEKRLLTKKRSAASKLAKNQEQSERYLRETSVVKMHSKKKQILIKPYRSLLQDKIHKM